MFDLGWDEMALIAVVALLVLGPKELPNALRTASTWMRAARKLAGEFQSGVNDIIKEADLEDARKKLNDLKTTSLSKTIENTVDPTGELKTTFKLDEPTATPAPETPPAVSAPETPALTAAPSDGPTLPPPTETAEVVVAATVAAPVPETSAAEKS